MRLARERFQAGLERLLNRAQVALPLEPVKIGPVVLDLEQDPARCAGDGVRRARFGRVEVRLAQKSKAKPNMAVLSPSCQDFELPKSLSQP